MFPGDLLGFKSAIAKGNLGKCGILFRGERRSQAKEGNIAEREREREALRTGKFLARQIQGEFPEVIGPFSESFRPFALSFFPSLSNEYMQTRRSNGILEYDAARLLRKGTKAVLLLKQVIGALFVQRISFNQSQYAEIIIMFLVQLFYFNSLSCTLFFLLIYLPLSPVVFLFPKSQI